MKTIKKRDVSPEYHRIPHFNKDISMMTHDDIVLDSPQEFPIDSYIEEKIDGASMGISWMDDGPILRNREHILKKGYSKIRTPAKMQFTSAWNWVHSHEDDIKEVSNIWQSPITIYGEWMNFTHSIHYDKLPDVFIAYDIWSLEDRKFLAPNIVSDLLDYTNIKYITPLKTTLESIDDIIQLSERKSNYRDGLMEGIVIKTSDGRFLKDVWKVVNKFFKRRSDFNEKIIKNIITK